MISWNSLGPCVRESKKTQFKECTEARYKSVFKQSSVWSLGIPAIGVPVTDSKESRKQLQLPQTVPKT